METSTDTDSADPGTASCMHHLPSSTVRLIASSQVITSIVSVVKELVENSLDAAATSIDVKLEGFGLEKVEVRDNGSGIKPSDTPYMARPHYTSKISSTEDLESLTTYGFRGEALGSLCNVSDVSITTKTSADDVSLTYTVDRTGQVTNTRPSHLGQGTTVTALNLFKNLPVRKQYYNTAKKKKEELKKLEDLVVAFGLVNHGVRLTLRNGKDLIWQKSAVTEPRSALLAVFGTTVMNQMEHVKRKSSELNLEVEGFLPKKSASSQTTSRVTNDRCFVFVNKRPVCLKEIEKLLRQSYTSGLGCESGRYPMAYLHILASPDCVDVNVDPNKTKVMLHNKEDFMSFLQSILEEVYGPVVKPEKPTKQCDENTPQESFDAPAVSEEDTAIPKSSTFSNGSVSGLPYETTNEVLQRINENCEETVQKSLQSLHPREQLEGAKASVGETEIPVVKDQCHQPNMQLDKSLASNLGDPVCHSTLLNAVEQTEDFQAEISDLELLQFIPENGEMKDNDKKMNDRPDQEDGRILNEQQGQTAVPLTQSLNFDLSLDSDDLFSLDIETPEKTPEDKLTSKTSAGEFSHRKEQDLSKSDAPDFTAIKSGSADPELTDRSIGSGPESARDSSDKDTNCDSVHVSTKTYIPGLSLADAVLSEDKNKSENMTGAGVADWSRGVSVEKADGSVVQPVTLLQPTLLNHSTSSLNTSTSPFTPSAGKRKSLDLSPSQTTLYDLIGNCTVKRPTTAYIYFSKEVRPEVLSQNPKAGFQEIAKIIGEKWKSLTEAEKAKYDNLMSKDIQRYREQTRQASDSNNNSRNSAKKLHLQCKRRKINQDQSVFRADNTSSSSSLVKVLPDLKTVTVEFSLSALKQRFAAGFKSSQQPAESSDVFKPIGQLRSHAVWLCLHGNQIEIVHPIRVQEELLHHKLLSNHSLPSYPLEKCISLDDRLEAEERATLSMMRKSAGHPSDSYTYYTDPRLLSNGFRIREHVDDPSLTTRPEICQLADCLNFYGIKDLQEILQHVAADSDVRLKDCRPARVKHYLQGEAVRMARQLPPRVTKEELMDILQQLESGLPEGQTLCFHNRPFLMTLYDLENVPVSQYYSQTPRTDGH